jgi:hypothetical protein
MPITIIESSPGGDNGSWGSKLNTALDTIVAGVNANEAAAAAALPLAGGAMTGRIDAKTATMAHVALGNVSGAVPLDLSAAQHFSASLSGAVVFSFTNTPAGVTGVVLRLTAAGAAAITWPAGTQWPGGSAPAFSAGVDVIVMLTDDGGTTWRTILAMKDVR